MMPHRIRTKTVLVCHLSLSKLGDGRIDCFNLASLSPRDLGLYNYCVPSTRSFNSRFKSMSAAKKILFNNSTSQSSHNPALSLYYNLPAKVLGTIHYYSSDGRPMLDLGFPKSRSWNYGHLETIIGPNTAKPFLKCN